MEPTTDSCNPKALEKVTCTKEPLLLLLLLEEPQMPSNSIMACRNTCDGTMMRADMCDDRKANAKEDEEEEEDVLQSGGTNPGNAAVHMICVSEG